MPICLAHCTRQALKTIGLYEQTGRQQTHGHDHRWSAPARAPAKQGVAALAGIAGWHLLPSVINTTWRAAQPSGACLSICRVLRG